MSTPRDPESLAALLGETNTSIGDALFALSEVLTERAGLVEHGRFALDELADTVAEPTTTGIVNALFGADGFRGDVEDYHSEENSLLDRVLDRRLGMPVTLSAVVIEVGARVGVPLTMIGMPGHVIVGTDKSDHFIDAFGGVEVDTRWVEKRFEAIYGPGGTIQSSAMQTLNVVGAVNRVSNNLMRTWIDDDSAKLDRLLEVRSIMPGSPADRGMLIEVATGRARFDIAARLREANDPDDPEIDALWARLN